MVVQYDLTMAEPPSAPLTVPVNDQNAEYSPVVPLIKTVEYLVDFQPNYEPVWDVNDLSKFHRAVFSKSLGRRSALTVDPTPTSMVESFFPDSLLESWCKTTMAYAASRLPPSRRLTVTPTHMCYFLAMYYYMGTGGQIINFGQYILLLS